MAETNYLKNFVAGEKIKATEINDNNQFLLDKISDNATTVQQYVTTQISNLTSQLYNLLRVGAPQLSLDGVLPTNCIWLEGAEVSRTTYKSLFDIYGTTYGEGDGSTTFNLPNFLDHSIWGSTESGYAEGAIPNITGVFDVTNNWPTRAYGDGTASPRGTGAFTVTSRWSTNVAGNGGTGAVGVDFDFNASRSSTLYKDKIEYVQPTAVKVRVYTRYQ